MTDHYDRRLSVAALVNQGEQDATSGPAVESPMSSTAASTDTTPALIDPHDEKVLIAVSALGDMRSSTNARTHPFWDTPRSPAATSGAPTPSLSRASTSSRATSPATLNRSLEEDAEDADALLRDSESESQDRLLTRVSNLPLVNYAISAYDYSKANSSLINYGAGLVESSVKTISRPVIDRLPVEQLDEFACRQLDRLGRYGGKVEPPETDAASEARGRELSRLRDRSDSAASSNWADRQSPEATSTDGSGQQVQVASRRGWQTVLVEASGISAAISEENMKRLKYCLQWLQYATARIDQQILVLQRFLSSLEGRVTEDPRALVPFTAMKTLTDVKRDVIATVRQVVEVMSKYAGGALPEQARATVRSFILLLPERWTTAMQQQEADLSAEARSSTMPANGLLPSTAQRATHRVLTLATESLDMMRGATGVFKESLDRAEAWVERLRVIGIQRQQQRQHVIGMPEMAPTSPGVDLKGLSISPMFSAPTRGSRRASHSEPSDEETETEGESSQAAFARGSLRRRQRRRIASPSPAAAARLSGVGVSEMEADG